MKKPKTLIAELLRDLRYWQMMYRIELSGLRRIKARELEIVAKIREVQKGQGGIKPEAS